MKGDDSLIRTTYALDISQMTRRTMKTERPDTLAALGCVRVFFFFGGRLQRKQVESKSIWARGDLGVFYAFSSSVHDVL